MVNLGSLIRLSTCIVHPILSYSIKERQTFEICLVGFGKCAAMQFSVLKSIHKV